VWPVAVACRGAEVLALTIVCVRVCAAFKRCFGVLACAVQTPLHLAVEAGAADIIKLLLDAGKYD
jgi:hypothetical protein